MAPAMDMFTLSGIGFFLPQFTQTILGYNALQSAMALLPLSAIVVIFSTDVIDCHNRLPTPAGYGPEDKKQ